MRSALYEGVVGHRRHNAVATGHVAHGFDQRVTMALLFLDEIDEFVARHPLYSARRPNAVWFRRADYLGADAVPLEVAVRRAVQLELGVTVTGPIAVLTQLRTLGWLFNPLSVYYCFDATGTEVVALVLEVTSTPWHERHAYVLSGASDSAHFDKAMHVSPFLGLDQRYVLNWGTPDERIGLALSSWADDERVLDAVLTLRRLGSARRDLTRALWRHPLATYATSAGIYRHALRLAAKGAPFHARAKERGDKGHAVCRD